MRAQKKGRANDLGRDPVGRLLLRMALPSVAAQLVNALYNIVDRIYIGHIPENGSLAITGLGVCFPILMLVTATASLLGTGGGARAAIAMGEGDTEQAERILGSCTTALTTVGVGLSVLLLAIHRPMLYLFGASQDTIKFASSYLIIYLCGSVFVLLASGLNSFITTQGFSTIGMLTILIGAGLNLALDPLFIYVFGMGVAGAAVATVISQALSALWAVCFLAGKRTRLRIRRQNLRLNPKILGPVLAIGVSPFVMQSTESLLSITFNTSLQTYGGDTAVGAMTICTSLMQVLTMVCLGIAQGNQPIVGFNYGAGNLERVKRAFRLLLTCCITLSVVGWLLVELFPVWCVRLFSSDGTLMTYTAWAVRIYLAGLFILGVQMCCQQTFVAMGQAKISLFLACLRKLVLLIPLILILPRVLPLDPCFSVFLAEPVADILAATTTLSLFIYRFPKILAERRQQIEGQQGDFGPPGTA